VQRVGLDKKFLGEGITVIGNKVYMLTWTSGKVLVFDFTDDQLGEKP
jgi:glutaminyl-peptide cyclotransferase